MNSIFRNSIGQVLDLLGSYPLTSGRKHIREMLKRQRSLEFHRSKMQLIHTDANCSVTSDGGWTNFRGEWKSWINVGLRYLRIPMRVAGVRP
ncbi:MAG: hypothetical protein ACE361_17460 [Aureliella sp.]